MPPQCSVPEDALLENGERTALRHVIRLSVVVTRVTRIRVPVIPVRMGCIAKLRGAIRLVTLIVW